MLRSLYNPAMNCLASLCTWRPASPNQFTSCIFFPSVRRAKQEEVRCGSRGRGVVGGGFQLLQVASWDPRCPLLCSTSNVVNMRPFICKTPWVYNGLALCVCVCGGGGNGRTVGLASEHSYSLSLSLSPPLLPSFLLLAAHNPSVIVSFFFIFLPRGAVGATGSGGIWQGASECCELPWDGLFLAYAL